MSATEDHRLVRAETSFTPSHRFHIKAKDYNPQYCHIYSLRLKMMNERMRALAVQKWGHNVPILSRIIDSETKDQTQNECVVIGTLFKEMLLRGSVLDEFKEQNGISGGVQPLQNFASKDDYLILEDDTGRVGLGGDFMNGLAPYTVTGVVVAVKGSVSEEGFFHANDIVYAGEETQPLTSTTTASSSSSSSSSDIAMTVDDTDNHHADDTYMLLVSGLQVGASTSTDNTAASELSMQLLMDFVSGRLGGTADIALASKIVRVVVAGNSVVETTVQPGKERFTGSKHQSEALAPMRQLDSVLASVLGSVPVDLMPGATDPSNCVLPQQPLHPCLLPHSARFTSLTLVTNPYEATVGDVQVMGHAGQPIEDIARQTFKEKNIAADDADGVDAVAVDGMDTTDGAAAGGDDDGTTISRNGCTVVPASSDAPSSSSSSSDSASSSSLSHTPLNILRSTWRWGHLCPTAPDTLPCYPYTDKEPFILFHDKTVPSQSNATASASGGAGAGGGGVKRVLFAGNQRVFDSSLEVSADGRNTTLFVCVPSFRNTQEAVLVNLRSLTCRSISFKVSLDDEDNLTDREDVEGCAQGTGLGPEAMMME